LKEDYGNLGPGNPTEPLLSTAIGKLGKMLKQSPTKELNYFTDAKSINGANKCISTSRYFESVESIIKCR
jgi:hypothetical protein